MVTKIETITIKFIKKNYLRRKFDRNMVFIHSRLRVGVHVRNFTQFNLLFSFHNIGRYSMTAK